MEKRKWRGPTAQNIFIMLYILAMLAASGWLCVNTFGTERTMLIDDQDLVMQRRSTAIPVSMEIRESRWGAAEMEDRERMFEISQLMGRISLFLSKPAGSQDIGDIQGKITFIDGSSRAFSLGASLVYEERAYYSEHVEFELLALGRLLRKEMYTLKNLSSFFIAEHGVTLSAGENSRSLSSDETEQLRQTVLSSRLISDSTEREYNIRNRGAPLFLLIVKRYGNVNDVIYLTVYDNDYVEVADVTGGAGVVMRLAGDFRSVCQRLLQ